MSQPTAPRPCCAVTGFSGRPIDYASIASRGDRYALLGQTEDPATHTPVTFLALGSLSAAAQRIDLQTLTIANHLVLAPDCRGPERHLYELATELRTRHADAFERCGAIPGSRLSVHVYPDGGISVFDFEQPTRRIEPHARTSYEPNPKVGACVRAVIEPELACPMLDSGASFSVVPPP